MILCIRTTTCKQYSALTFVSATVLGDRCPNSSDLHADPFYRRHFDKLNNGDTDVIQCCCFVNISVKNKKETYCSV